MKFSAGSVPQALGVWYALCVAGGKPGVAAAEFEAAPGSAASAAAAHSAARRTAIGLAAFGRGPPSLAAATLAS